MIAWVVALGAHLDYRSVQAFLPATSFHRPPHTLCRVVSRLTNDETSSTLNDDDSDDDISFLFEEDEEKDAAPQKVAYEDLDVQEKAWRHAKRPLLRIGSKGATHAHGNSLRQLLEDHTTVKVKVNTKKFHNSTQEAFEVLKNLAIENGAPPDLELIQLREGTKEILFGMPGTLQKMQEGTYPPPPPPKETDGETDDDEPTLSA